MYSGLAGPRRSAEAAVAPMLARGLVALAVLASLRSSSAQSSTPACYYIRVSTPISNLGYSATLTSLGNCATSTVKCAGRHSSFDSSFPVACQLQRARCTAQRRRAGAPDGPGGRAAHAACRGCIRRAPACPRARTTFSRARTAAAAAARSWRPWTRRRAARCSRRVRARALSPAAACPLAAAGVAQRIVVRRSCCNEVACSARTACASGYAVEAQARGAQGRRARLCPARASPPAPSSTLAPSATRSGARATPSEHDASAPLAHSASRLCSRCAPGRALRRRGRGRAASTGTSLSPPTAARSRRPPTRR